MPSILDERPTSSFREFLMLCARVGVDPRPVASIATATVRYLRSDDAGRRRLMAGQEMEMLWYESLERELPDYGVYERDEYLGELWACWLVYSRAYLRAIRDPKSLPGGGIPNDLGPVRRVVDLGCGFGYTTAALAQMFGPGVVVGTNIGETPQTKVAQHLARRHGFDVVEEVTDGPVDLVFASEYFEHFHEPIAHLREILRLRPRALLTANAFGARGLGHFYTYCVEGALLTGSSTARRFDSEMALAGYAKVKTKMWNNRPTYWKRVA